MKKSLGAKPILIPVPVWVIGSYNSEDEPNIMTASWVSICCSKPACLSVALRKATYTFNNILHKKAFTVNVPSQEYIKQADFAGIFSGKKVKKFEVCGLTAIRSTLVDAPYVKEFPLIAECKLINTVTLGLHNIFIGEILDVKADDSILNKEGVPSLDKLRPFLYSPAESQYYSIGFSLGEIGHQ